MSKIKNRTAIRKNWIENGIRADDFGSNPHSKGDIFSRSIVIVFEIMVHIIINPMEIIIANVNEIKILIITSSLLRSFDWKSNILFILKKLTTSSVNCDI